MTDVSPAASPPTAPVVANGHDAALLAEAKRMIETTTWSQTQIAAQLDISQTTLSVWKRREGWVRPRGAPRAPMFDAAVRARRAAEPMATRTDLRRRRLIDLDARHTRLGKIGRGICSGDNRGWCIISDHTA